MIYGNKHAQEIFNKFSKAIQEWKISNWFFIISWASNIWKKTLINQLISNSWILHQDLLFIEDMQKEDWKFHQIRIEVDEKDRNIQINWKDFVNVWAREIVDFISKTPYWDFKLVFIENIERMNKSASNAMLKTLEEPPENVFIFASCTNKHKLLDTVISRWTLINMNELSRDDFKSYVLENHDQVDEDKLKLLYFISWWRAWFAKDLLSHDAELLGQVKNFIEMESLSVWIFDRFALVKDMISSWKIMTFLDWLIFYYTNRIDFKKTRKLIEIKNKSKSNVSMENLFFNYLLD